MRKLFVKMMQLCVAIKLYVLSQLLAAKNDREGHLKGIELYLISECAII